MKKIRLDGEVGWEISTQMVAEELINAAGDDVEISLNTKGGDAFDALDIYDQLSKYSGKKTIMLGGIVASAGTVLAAVENAEIIASPATAFMIHNPWVFMSGDYKELSKQASELRRIGKHMAERYSSLTKKDVEEIIDMMNEETWLYGQEIVDAGFAHKLSGESQKTDKVSDIAAAKRQVEMSFRKIAAKVQEIKLQEQVEEPGKNKHKEKTMPTKEESIALVKVEMDKASIAKEFGIDIVSAEDRKILASIKEAKIDDPLKVIADLKAKIKDGEGAIRQALLTDEFGKDDDDNVQRKYVEKETSGITLDVLKDEVAKIKSEDKVFKRLMAKTADYSDPLNTIGVSENGSETDKLDDGVVYC